jgi:flavin reductase
MARLATAVNIVTTDGIAGRHGITASAVCSVTDNPPTLLICVNRASRANALIRQNGVVCVNVLAARHRGLSDAFAGSSLSVRFAEGDWMTTKTGALRLDDAVVALDCRISSVAEVGTHSVFFCEIAEIVANDQREALLYFGREYHSLSVDQAVSR